MTLHRKASRELLERLGANVKRMRAAQGYTQAAFSVHCGFARGQLSNIECAYKDVTLGTIERLAVALGCRFEDLLDDTDGNP